MRLIFHLIKNMTHHVPPFRGSARSEMRKARYALADALSLEPLLGASLD
jgi:hypothetical protein